MTVQALAASADSYPSISVGSSRDQIDDIYLIIMLFLVHAAIMQASNWFMFLMDSIVI